MAQNGFFIMSDGRRSCDVVTSKPGKRKVATEKTVKTKDRGTQTSKGKAKSTTSKKKNSSDQAFGDTEKPKKKPAAASAALLSLDFSDQEKPKKRQKLDKAPKMLDSP